ncbi:MAG: right-handed parallel beta-helix repeat-containing protein [Spirochaetes bacterium]|nr:right-handed parallel beta-helix repeat-containing protein [Spirochaetota bacterium]
MGACRNKYFKCCIIAVIFISGISTGFCTSYYVDDDSNVGDVFTLSATGNDINSGLASDLPKRNIISIFTQYTLVGGDIVYVDTGLYDGINNEIKLGTGSIAGCDDDNGSADNYFTIRGAGINNTHIDGNGARWYNFNFKGRKWIKIADMYMNASLDHENILFEQSTNCMVTNCRIYQAINGCGISIWKSERTKIIGCVVGDNIDGNKLEGIMIKSNSHYNQILNSRVFFNKLSGIKIENNSDYNIIEGNQIYRNNDDNIDWNGGIVLIGNGGICDYTVIRNNIIGTNKKYYNVLLEDTTKCTLENNTICYITGGDGDYRCNIRMNNADNCVIRSNKIHNGTYHGIYIQNSSDNNQILCNNIYNNGWNGINMVDDGGGDTANNRIETNNIHNNGTTGDQDYRRCGIYFKNSPNTLILRNLIYQNQQDGIRIDEDSNKSTFINNTFFKNGGRGIIFNNDNTTSCTLRNCISQSNSDQGIRVVNNPSPYLVHTYNSSYGNNVANYQYDNSSPDATEIQSNASFQSTDPSSSFFLYLSPSYSPCINTGAPDDTVPAKGGSRIDMGATETTNQPPQVTLLTPADSGSSEVNSIEFTWNSVTGGTLGIDDYTIEVASSPDFIALSFTGTTAALSSTTALNNGKYYWRVRANDNAGNAGPWSLTRTITIGREESSVLQEGEVKAYPIPCTRDSTLALKYGFNSQKTLESVNLTIWDIRGNEVISRNVYTGSASSGSAEWDLKNSRGYKIMPGVYPYRVELKYADGSTVTSDYKKIIISK